MRNTCTLIYHGISRAGGFGTLDVRTFERQLSLLAQLVTFVNLRQAHAQPTGSRRQVLLTFDDGFHNNYAYAVPILKRLGIPAVFFVSDRHCVAGRFLWFSYLRALKASFPVGGLEWRGKQYDFHEAARTASVREIEELLLDLRPHPEAAYAAIEAALPPLRDFVSPDTEAEYFAGLSTAELQEIGADPLFSIAIHTSDHPLLTRCTAEEARTQILHNAAFLRDATGADPVAIAYPSGDYDDRVLEICRALKIPLGFAVTPMSNEGGALEQGRIGVYSSSLVALLIKVYMGTALRRAGVPLG